MTSCCIYTALIQQIDWPLNRYGWFGRICGMNATRVPYRCSLRNSFAAVQLIESWLLTPKIMANRSGLHPALVVISLFFWGTVLGGIIGMVLAVPLTAFFVAIWREIKTSLEHALK